MRWLEASRRRRFLFGSVAAVLGVLGYRGWRAFGPATITFKALEQPAGFRSIDRGQLSSTGFSPLLGVGRRGQSTPQAVRAEAVVDKDLCAALFGKQFPPEPIVSIASFSDFYCPYCRLLTPLVAHLEREAGSRLSVVWHEYPILGQASRMAARAALAAKRQGAYSAFQEKMFTTAFQPTPGYLSNLCRAIGIDFTRMLADMDSDEVKLELAISTELARRFGFYGTPDLIVGKTVVEGAIEERMLRDLIEIERQEGARNPCTNA